MWLLICSWFLVCSWLLKDICPQHSWRLQKLCSKIGALWKKTQKREMGKGRSISRGISLLQIAYEIFPKTKGFLGISNSNNRSFHQRCTRFFGVICPSLYLMGLKHIPHLSKISPTDCKCGFSSIHLSQGLAVTKT